MDAEWLAHTADHLVGQAPEVAAKLLTRAVAGSPPGWDRRGWLEGRLADALYLTGDYAQAEKVVQRALEQATDPTSLWTCTGLSRSAAAEQVFLQSLLRR